MPTSEAVVDALCRMPQAFKNAGETTMVALLQVSQYHRESRITEAHIEAHLRKHPDFVNPWVEYSEAQRTLPGWYLMRPRAGSTEEWRVDYLTKREPPLEHTFADEFEACAFFIMRKVEELSRLAG